MGRADADNMLAHGVERDAGVGRPHPQTPERRAKSATSNVPSPSRSKSSFTDPMRFVGLHPELVAAIEVHDGRHGHPDRRSDVLRGLDRPRLRARDARRVGRPDAHGSRAGRQRVGHGCTLGVSKRAVAVRIHEYDTPRPSVDAVRVNGRPSTGFDGDA